MEKEIPSYCYVCGSDCLSVSFDEDDIFLLKDSVEQLVCMNDIKEQLTKAIQEKLLKRSPIHRKTQETSPDRLPELVRSLNDVRVRIAEREIGLDSKRELLKKLRKQRRLLAESVTLQNNLKDAISIEVSAADSALPYLRWRAALRVLNMCNLQVLANVSAMKERRTSRFARIK